MPSVPVKRVEQQALVALHRVREQWMTTWTARINTLRGILREPGLLLPAGARAAVQPVRMLLEETKPTLPPHLRTVLTELLAAQRRRAAAPPLTRLHHWALTVRDRRGHNKATMAVANELGRPVWAVWHQDGPFAVPDAA
jgi:hypothetical protein